MNKSLVEKILDLTKTENSNWYQRVSEYEKKSIEKDISDANKGNLEPHSEAKKIYE
jgi:hypothetical protein